MPSLDDLKKRIKSVKSTQKITKAMKMVAAAKLKKAQENAENGRPYSKKLQKIILNLTNAVYNDENAPKLLIGNGSDKVYLCVVITADKGLCGSFNSSICKSAKNFFKKIFLFFSRNLLKHDPQSTPMNLPPRSFQPPQKLLSLSNRMEPSQRLPFSSHRPLQFSFLVLQLSPPRPRPQLYPQEVIRFHTHYLDLPYEDLHPHPWTPHRSTCPSHQHIWRAFLHRLHSTCRTRPFEYHRSKSDQHVSWKVKSSRLRRRRISQRACPYEYAREPEIRHFVLGTYRTCVWCSMVTILVSDTGEI